MRSVSGAGVVGAEDRRSVQASIRLAGGHHPLVRGQGRQGIVEGLHRVVVPVEQVPEQPVSFGGTGEEPLRVGVQPGQMGTDVNRTVSLPGRTGVVCQAAFEQPLHEAGAVIGIESPAQDDAGNLPGNQRLEGPWKLFQNLCRTAFGGDPSV